MNNSDYQAAIDMAVSALSKALLHDKNIHVRCTAAESLGNIPNPKAISSLLEALEDTSPEVRQTVIRAIGDLCSTFSTKSATRRINRNQNSEGIHSEKEPINIFFSYSHKDENLRDQLALHLNVLSLQGLISTWHDRKITPGEERSFQLESNCNSAQIILPLLSADFLASNHCYGIAMQKAIERHETGQACVIPVILRPVDWINTPFGWLHVLPKDAKPVTTWDNQDEAFVNIVQGIRIAVERLL